MEGRAAAGDTTWWTKEGGGGARLEETWKALTTCGPGGGAVIVEGDERVEAADAVGSGAGRGLLVGLDVGHGVGCWVNERWIKVV